MIWSGAESCLQLQLSWLLLWLQVAPPAQNSKFPDPAKAEIPRDQNTLQQAASPVATLSSHMDPFPHYIASAACGCAASPFTHSHAWASRAAQHAPRCGGCRPMATAGVDTHLHEWPSSMTTYCKGAHGPTLQPACNCSNHCKARCRTFLGSHGTAVCCRRWRGILLVRKDGEPACGPAGGGLLWCLPGGRVRQWYLAMCQVVLACLQTHFRIGHCNDQHGILSVTAWSFGCTLRKCSCGRMQQRALCMRAKLTRHP